jgi:diaminopimelate decarboxylase
MPFAELAPIFPETAQVTPQNRLAIGGCDAVELAGRFGTPLYVFDEATLRNQCREFRREFSQRYPQVTVAYASKAFINRGLARILIEEGLGLDVVSIGELAIAHAVEYPLQYVYFHGNNKGSQELEQALDWGIGHIVVDNFYELGILEQIAAQKNIVQPVLLRLSPGVDPHTHEKTTTGILDSKFGFPLQTGDAQRAVQQALTSRHLKVLGLHFHLGSPLFEVEPYRTAIELTVVFAAEMKRQYGLSLDEFNPGGGFAIQYVRETPPPPISAYAEAITSALKEQCQAQGLSLPRLVIEPGRAIVGRAGIALYTTGAVKEIPGVRKYISVDGGMGDNIRPAIYGSRYEAVVANRVEGNATETVTIAGKYCESGDVLLKDMTLPRLVPGDLLAVPASGAYCLAMASNYNASLKPAIVLVKDGKARLLRRRETLDDLMQTDVLP